MAETYIPVLDVIRSAPVPPGHPFLTLSLTPVLLEQLADSYMQSRFLEYLDQRIEAARRDAERFGDARDDRLAGLARFYADYYEHIRGRFTDEYDCGLIGAIRDMVADGRVEVLASAATHAYLPLLSKDSSISAQVKIGIEACRRHFDCGPRGIWLPECGYSPGRIERALEDCGIQYFFADTHAVSGGAPMGLYGPEPAGVRQCAALPGLSTYRPYRLRGWDLAVFGRDEATAAQVWSRDWGYPGDGAYREFHKRDDRSGLPYWRVTNRLLDLGQKDIYNIEAARATARTHAKHFVRLLERGLSRYLQETGEAGVIVSPFDMELFGHWWFEGVQWLQDVFDILLPENTVQMTSAGEYLAAHPPTIEIDLVESSWGQGGGHSIWLNSGTRWMWESVVKAEQIAGRLGADAERLPQEARDFADQAVREFLLLSASDWPFLVTTGQARDYAQERFTRHLEDFHLLAEAADRAQPTDSDREALARVRERDAVFQWVDCSKL
jgi:1,4-alpha-glucan branching enzyme